MVAHSSFPTLPSPPHFPSPAGPRPAPTPHHTPITPPHVTPSRARALGTTHPAPHPPLPLNLTLALPTPEPQPTAPALPASARPAWPILHPAGHSQPRHARSPSTRPGASLGRGRRPQPRPTHQRWELLISSLKARRRPSIVSWRLSSVETKSTSNPLLIRPLPSNLQKLHTLEQIQPPTHY